MKDAFILEIGFEELPARHCKAVLDQLTTRALSDLSQKNNLSFEELTMHLTPRRLVLLSNSLSQVKTTQEIRGPLYEIAYTEGKPNKVAKKFAESNDLKVTELQEKDHNGKKFIVAKKDLTKEINQNIQSFLDDVIDSIRIGRPMRWDSSGMKFSRPIRWLLCYHGKTLVPLMVGNVISEKFTYGPRFLGSPKIAVSHAKEFEDLLAKNKIIADHKKRTALVSAILKKIESAQDLVYTDNGDELIEETVFLTEYPQPLFCNFRQEFLDLPAEVISTVLIKHQKYFPLHDKKTGDMSPTFLVIANYDKESKLIADGNQKVVNGRLRDAVYFFEQDTKSSLEDMNSRIDTITFQEELGSMKDKAERMANISIDLSSFLDVDKKKLKKSAELCKADLASNMVTEFPSLEGTMGRIYAETKGLDSDISAALSEYYRPRHSEDSLPESNLALILSLAERIDTIYGLFSIGLKPKGSSDPFGLRRAAIAIVRILWENELDISLTDLLKAAEKTHSKKASHEEIKHFILSRLEQYLKMTESRKIDTSQLRSVVHNTSDTLSAKKVLLDELSSDGSGKKYGEFIELTKRIYNIAVKGKERKQISLDQKSLNQTESSFLTAIKKLSSIEKPELDDFFTLTAPGTEFFENNMVMSEDTKEREKRLELLWLAYEQISRGFNAKYLLS